MVNARADPLHVGLHVRPLGTTADLTSPTFKPGIARYPVNVCSPQGGTAGVLAVEKLSANRRGLYTRFLFSPAAKEASRQQ